MKNIKRYIILFLALAMLLPLCPVDARAASFPDTPGGSWYGEYLDPLVMLEIVRGYPDGTFRPDNKLTRGEFLRMLSTATELITMNHDTSIHWAQEDWQMAYEAELLYVEYDEKTSGFTVLFPCTAAALNQEISRYEMAVLISNAMSKARFEGRVQVANAKGGIKDYASIADKYKDAVEQAYGKGVLTGYSDTSFQGDRSLTRAEACVAIYRLLWSKERQPANFATEVEEPSYTPATYESFAFKYRNMSSEDRRIALFGSAGKTHFTSAADAAGWITDVTIPVWRVNSSGEKYSTQVSITVHKLVAQEVKLIFNEIYNDAERFPIEAIGGARFTDSLRHSWGCAIDINPTQNYYCRTVDGVTTALVGTHWSPGADQYSISPGGSVVRAFAKYGWGWGGQGWSGGYYDYMHFSILSTGG